MTDPAHDPSAAFPADPVAAWRRAAPDAVLLDGFHALKHAVRFGAEVLVAVTADRAAALTLADELAGDVRDTLAALLTQVPHGTYAALVPRPHPTAVAALAVRPGRAGNLAKLAHAPRTAPVVVLDQPRNLGNAGAVVRLAARLRGDRRRHHGDAGPLAPHRGARRGGAALRHRRGTPDRGRAAARAGVRAGPRG